MKNSRRRWIYSITLLTALATGIYYFTDYLRERALHALPHGFKKFNLSDPLPACDRWKQHMPSTRDPATYHLYIEARKVLRSKIEWQLTREETMRILIDVRKAADLGDWGARALMAHFYLEGLGVLESNHVLDADPDKGVAIARMAAEAMQPWGLYDLGVAYEHGYGGAHYDVDLAWAYYLKAAELGSPEAQMALATAYREAGRLEDEDTMQRCAYQQGHGAAAYQLAIKAEIYKRYKEALNIYQDGVKFGDHQCSAALYLLFDDGHWTSSNDEEKAALKALGIRADPERSRRYKEISDALQIDPDQKLSRLDQVLPLPPAQLPAWSGVDDAAEPESESRPTY